MSLKNFIALFGQQERAVLGDCWRIRGRPSCSTILQQRTVLRWFCEAPDQQPFKHIDTGWRNSQGFSMVRLSLVKKRALFALYL